MLRKSILFCALILIVNGFTVEKLDLQVDITKEVKCSVEEKAAKGDKVENILRPEKSKKNFALFCYLRLQFTMVGFLKMEPSLIPASTDWFPSHSNWG